MLNICNYDAASNVAKVTVVAICFHLCGPTPAFTDIFKSPESGEQHSLHARTFLQRMQANNGRKQCRNTILSLSQE